MGDVDKHEVRLFAGVVILGAIGAIIGVVASAYLIFKDPTLLFVTVVLIACGIIWAYFAGAVAMRFS